MRISDWSSDVCSSDLHRLVHRLACHHCGHVMPPPRLCPECEDEDSLVACGPGVERVADEVKLRFPEARTAIVTSDTLWSPAKAAEFVAHVEAGLVDKLGRASCRERVCQSVSISVVAGALKNKNNHTKAKAQQ